MTDVSPNRRIRSLVLRSPEAESSTTYVASFLPTLAPASTGGFGAVVFREHGPSLPATTQGLDAYWKFSVFTDDIVELRDALVDSGRQVTEPIQFGEIGYLCHLDEPGGNAIELLQRTFKDNPAAAHASPHRLGLVTLRVTDVAASLDFYRSTLGMRLLSTMAVDDGRPDPFDLYFLGWVDAEPPMQDPSAVGNREWTYQRQSTLIELQHYRTLPEHGLTDRASSRLDHVEIEVPDLAALQRALVAAGIDTTSMGSSIQFASPDGHLFVANALA